MHLAPAHVYKTARSFHRYRLIEHLTDRTQRGPSRQDVSPG
jgi:hypothetical protein